MESPMLDETHYFDDHHLRVRITETPDRGWSFT